MCTRRILLPRPGLRVKHRTLHIQLRVADARSLSRWNVCAECDKLPIVLPAPDRYALRQWCLCARSAGMQPRVHGIVADTMSGRGLRGGRWRLFNALCPAERCAMSGSNLRSQSAGLHARLRRWPNAVLERCVRIDTVSLHPAVLSWNDADTMSGRDVRLRTKRVCAHSDRFGVGHHRHVSVIDHKWDRRLSPAEGPLRSLNSANLAFSY